MKNKQLLAVLCVIVLVLLASLTWWYMHRDELAVQAYVHQVNERLAQQSAFIQSAQASETPEKKARTASRNKILKMTAEAELGTPKFFGRVIDQYGNPVAGVTVSINLGGNGLMAGSGGGSRVTDADGYFEVSEGSGLFLGVGPLKKSGYEINDIQPSGGTGFIFYSYPVTMGETRLWSNHSDREHAFIFKAWGVEKYAQVKSEDKRYLSFVPNGPVYTVDFSGEERVKWEGMREGDIRIAFTRNEKDWNVKIDAVNGGIQESSDEYMNLAPESGYQKSLTYSGFAKDNFNVSRGISVNKSMYFMSNNGKRYGSLHLEIIPYYNEKESGIYATYTINLEQGRELAVKPEE